MHKDAVFFPNRDRIHQQNLRMVLYVYDLNTSRTLGTNAQFVSYIARCSKIIIHGVPTV